MKKVIVSILFALLSVQLYAVVVPHTHNHYGNFECLGITETGQNIVKNSVDGKYWVATRYDVVYEYSGCHHRVFYEDRQELVRLATDEEIESLNRPIVIFFIIFIILTIIGVILVIGNKIGESIASKQKLKWLKSDDQEFLDMNLPRDVKEDKEYKFVEFLNINQNIPVIESDNKVSIKLEQTQLKQINDAYMVDIDRDALFSFLYHEPRDNKEHKVIEKFQSDICYNPDYIHTDFNYSTPKDFYVIPPWLYEKYEPIFTSNRYNFIKKAEYRKLRYETLDGKPYDINNIDFYPQLENLK